MDSGNSGSFQSSTGDEEFDSHGDGISALNNLAAAHVSSFVNQQPPPPPPCNTVSSYMYDHRQQPPPPPPPPPQQPLENYQRSFMNSYVLDWSNNNAQRSETFNPMLPSSVSASNNHHGSAAVLQPPSVVLLQQQPPSMALQEPPPPPPLKKPRKRSRASRGTATTVLTTDTTNFRAMVQEFTGIPEPPFPSHFQNNRLDLFSSVSGITSPPYLRRPFPQKINLPFSSSLGSSSSSSSNTNNMNINATTNALNYQFTPQSSPSLFNNLQNQFVPSFLGMKTHQESRDFASNDDFGGQVNSSMIRPTGFLGLISSEDQRTSTNNNQSAVRWGNGTGSSQEDHQSHVITSAANSNFSFSSS